ncbi:MAG: periplasmic heavy metal sensor [Alphaproteobacteria bacterium GM7ARS4]|nr:periplasmic heavy metal sensor [Alphaproteobacteria bacterium GM7ARS4]
MQKLRQLLSTNLGRIAFVSILLNGIFVGVAITIMFKHGGYRMHARFHEAQDHLSATSQEQMEQSATSLRAMMHGYRSAMREALRDMRSILTEDTMDKQALQQRYQQWRDAMTRHMDDSYALMENIIADMEDDERQAFFATLLKEPLPLRRHRHRHGHAKAPNP